MAKISDTEQHDFLLEVVQAIGFVQSGSRTEVQVKALRKALDLFNQDGLFKVKLIPPKKYMLFEPVSCLELPTMVHNSLSNNNVDLVGELVQKQERELLRYKLMGKVGLGHINDALRVHGLRLNMQLDAEDLEKLATAKKTVKRW